MNFQILIEENDWEGETWKFYIQVDGNEEAMEELSDIVSTHSEITLGDIIPESEVDILVKHSDSGYMAYHNKVTGVLSFPDRESFEMDQSIIDFAKADAEEDGEEFDIEAFMDEEFEESKDLYKGGIFNFIK